MLHVTMMVPRPSEPLKMATQRRFSLQCRRFLVCDTGRARIFFAHEYFYSPQSSSVVKSKMAATTIRT